MLETLVRFVEIFLLLLIVIKLIATIILKGKYEAKRRRIMSALAAIAVWTIFVVLINTTMKSLSTLSIFDYIIVVVMLVYIIYTTSVALTHISLLEI